MERMISGTVRRTCRFQVERAFSILNEMTKLPRTFDDFADHRRIAENILRLLREDERVLGVYLSGSFVAGNPDRYSDLDLYLLMRKQHRKRIKQDHSSLRAKVGELLSDFPATHMGDPNQIICLYSGTYPVHVDYQYRAPEELVPRAKGRNALVFWDRSGELRLWKKKSVPRFTKNTRQLPSPFSISKIDSGPGAFTLTQRYVGANSGKLEI